MIVFNMKRLLLGVVFAWVALYIAPLFAQTNQLTGRISMPSGVVPVSSPAVFRVSSVPLDTVDLNGVSSQTFTDVSIEPLSSFADYSIPLLDSEPGVGQQEVQRKLRFDCLSGCANIRITTTGYWGGSAGVVSEVDAIEFNAFAPQVINIMLERADHFSGTFEFPNGVSATGEEIFTVTLKGSQFTDPPTFTQMISADLDDVKWSFFVGVPASSTGGGWTLSLSCDSCDPSIPEGPYFPTTGAGDPVTTDSANQFFFLKNRVYSNIQLTLPSPPFERKEFSIAPLTLLLFDE
ncbi:hypothetical protein NBRC116583_09100 [Arenicella sp. 4NH20-0111]|uniref:hypothetical protein n=1 Tax=Arenicella sp. 4NH20-0111 TaxID=3127648 RepID=UPI0031020D55